MTNLGDITTLEEKLYVIQILSNNHIHNIIILLHSLRG